MNTTTTTTTTPATGRSIVIEGREWHRRSVGGMYCTARVYVDDEYIGRAGPVGGSGDMCLQIAGDLLTAKGIYPDQPGIPTWRRVEMAGDKMRYSIATVSRERDL